MKIFLNEIKDIGVSLNFNEKNPWVIEAVASTDENYQSLSMQESLTPHQPHSRERTVSLTFKLHKISNIYEVKGTLETEMHLICSRCAKSFFNKCNTSFSQFFTQDPSIAGGNGEDSSDCDITFLIEDFIDLGAILTEQLQLQVPFQPLCSENCKGMCQVCGTDLNTGRCACGVINSNTPFSALKSVKVWKKDKKA